MKYRILFIAVLSNFIFLIFVSCWESKKTYFSMMEDSTLSVKDTIKINSINSNDTAIINLNWEKDKEIKKIYCFIRNEAGKPLQFTKILHFKEDFIGGYSADTIKNKETTSMNVNCSHLNLIVGTNKRRIGLEGILDNKKYKIIILFNIFVPK